MIRLLISVPSTSGANAIGLLLAALVLSGMTIDGAAFLLAVIIFTLIEVIAQPLIMKIAGERRSSPTRLQRCPHGASGLEHPVELVQHGSGLTHTPAPAARAGAALLGLCYWGSGCRQGRSVAGVECLHTSGVVAVERCDGTADPEAEVVTGWIREPHADLVQVHPHSGSSHQGG